MRKTDVLEWNMRRPKLVWFMCIFDENCWIDRTIGVLEFRLFLHLLHFGLWRWFVHYRFLVLNDAPVPKVNYVFGMISGMSNSHLAHMFGVTRTFLFRPEVWSRNQSMVVRGIFSIVFLGDLNSPSSIINHIMLCWFLTNLGWQNIEKGSIFVHAFVSNAWC